jgi:LacI family transcriptional regulator
VQAGRPAAAPTISVIAKKLGVSRSTVSRAFTRPHLLRPETVERVLAAAEDLSYVPNSVARALSTGHNGIIALIVPDIANPFFPPLIRAAQAGADLQDFCVLLGDSAENPDQETRLINRFTKQVDGFVLASSRLPDQALAEHAKRKPLVLVNRDIPRVPRVLVDSTAGIMQSVAHLAELGHENIAYVGGPPGSWSDHQRRRAIAAARAEHGLAVTMLNARPATYAGGTRVVEALLASDATAVIAFDDVVAHGILAGLAERRVRVPDDFSVIGCDDVLAATTYPPLTTVTLHCADAGEIAVSVLLQLLGGRELGDVRYSLDSSLTVRGTTGPASKRLRGCALLTGARPAADRAPGRLRAGLATEAPAHRGLDGRSGSTEVLCNRVHRTMPFTASRKEAHAAEILDGGGHCLLRGSTAHRVHRRRIAGQVAGRDDGRTGDCGEQPAPWHHPWQLPWREHR